MEIGSAGPAGSARAGRRTTKLKLVSHIPNQRRLMNQLNQRSDKSDVCQSIDWYHEGDARMVLIGQVCIIVHFVGRKGRRARIRISAPAGADFCEIGEASSNSAASTP
jgi:hypothetical protein